MPHKNSALVPSYEYYSPRKNGPHFFTSNESRIIDSTCQSGWMAQYSARKCICRMPVTFVELELEPLKCSIKTLRHRHTQVLARTTRNERNKQLPHHKSTPKLFVSVQRRQVAKFQPGTKRPKGSNGASDGTSQCRIEDFRGLEPTRAFSPALHLTRNSCCCQPELESASSAVCSP